LPPAYFCVFFWSIISHDFATRNPGKLRSLGIVPAQKNNNNTHYGGTKKLFSALFEFPYWPQKKHDFLLLDETHQKLHLDLKLHNHHSNDQKPPQSKHIKPPSIYPFFRPTGRQEQKRWSGVAAARKHAYGTQREKNTDTDVAFMFKRKMKY